VRKGSKGHSGEYRQELDFQKVQDIQFSCGCGLFHPS